MSRGPGLWQRLILDQLKEDLSFPLRELWRQSDPRRTEPWSAAEFAALHRAAHALAKSDKCRLLVADDIDQGRRRHDHSDRAILFVTRTGVSVKEVRRTRRGRLWITFVSLTTEATWVHDEWPGPVGQRWERVGSTKSPRGSLVARADATALERIVGLGGRLLDGELEDRARVAREILADPGDRRRNTFHEMPRGEWEHLVSARLTGEGTRAVALAIVLMGGPLSGFITGPTVSTLEKHAGGRLRHHLRRLARLGFLYVDERGQLFVLRGNELPGPESKATHTKRAIDRLEASYSRGNGTPYDTAMPAELIAEITTTVPQQLEELA